MLDLSRELRRDADKATAVNRSVDRADAQARARQGDAQLRELKKLKKIHAGSETELKIDSFIKVRMEEITEEKKKDITVDMSQIPPELRDLVSN